MAEVLSQQEIDQLLTKAKSGAEPSSENLKEKEAVIFDFRLPNRISKNQLRSLRNIHENFAESFASYLVSKLQSVVTLNVTTVDQIYYSEYILSVANPACLFTFEIENSDIKGILELNSDFALTLVDRLLGGSGTSTKQSKMITPIEQKVLTVVVERIMLDLKKAWQSIDDFGFKVERFESDVDFAQITSQSESVLLTSFEIVIGEETYLMNICFATFAFDNILSKLSSQKFSTIRHSKIRGVASTEIIKKNLSKAIIPVKVEFGTSSISFNELCELSTGDIIKLNDKIGDEHIVKAGSKILFYGKAGVLNKHKAIKITKKVFTNENQNE